MLDSGDRQIRFPAIILAAGISRRMGQPKAQLQLGGRAMIWRLVDTFIESCCASQITVVTGYEPSKIEEALAGCPVNYIYNSNYLLGEMLSSVQAGIRSLASDCGAFFLSPGDLPLVRASTIKSVAQLMAVAMPPVVHPAYQGKRGHPVLISSAIIPDILALSEGETLKSALIKYSGRSIEVEVEDPGILFDVDSPEDFEEASRRVIAAIEL